MVQKKRRSRFLVLLTLGFSLAAASGCSATTSTTEESKQTTTSTRVAEESAQTPEGSVLISEPVVEPNVPVGSQSVVIERVVDGDTMVLTDGRKIRVVGIDTPETKHPTIGVECHGPEASRYAEDVLDGRTTRLEPDGGQDRYGRTLGHLWFLAGDEWLNYGEQALLEGHAERYRDGEHRYSAEYIEAERRARESRTGLWAACQ